MHLFIPTLGVKLRLLQDWTFALYHEGRNLTLAKALKLKGSEESTWGWSSWRDPAAQQIIIPTGTILTVDRIYIRRSGGGEYDSVTFRIAKGGCPADKRFEKTRFWAKLEEVNQIDCEIEKAKGFALNSVNLDKMDG